MSKHAPGPWKVTSESHNPLIECEDGYVIAQIKGVSLSVEGFDCEANARLIAAAPRMYELLVEARELLDQYFCGCDDKGLVAWNEANKALLDEIDGQEESHE